MILTNFMGLYDVWFTLVIHDVFLQSHHEHELVDTEWLLPGKIQEKRATRCKGTLPPLV